MNKATRGMGIALAVAAVLSMGACTAITSGNADDAAAAVGLGSDGAYSKGNPSILARTVTDNSEAFSQGKSVDFGASYGGGTVAFATVSASAMPDSSQDGSFTADSYCSVTYKNVTVVHEGKSYTLDGTIYMRLDVVSLTSMNFVLTGRLDISGSINDSADIDVVFNASSSGYSFQGTVNNYSVNSSLTIS